MCGIFGVVGSRSFDGLRAAAQTLHHRGPDAFGEWTSTVSSVYLAHCRLSIIDLSAAGTQPLANEDGTVQIVYNGEIYNFDEIRKELVEHGHQFRSRTDTEVIVHAYEQWGHECVERFRGIFAFGLWDERRGRLLLVRDRLGVKPLYYNVSGQQIAFASEPRALLGLSGPGRALNVSAAVQFLQYSYTTGVDTIWQGIHRLPPGHMLEYSSQQSTLRLSCYWKPSADLRKSSFSDATDQAEAMLAAAVSEELVSDVPVGVFLSGGVDSSLTATYATKASPHLQSFCVDFTGWSGSEIADSRRVAEHLQTRHHACMIDQATSVFADDASSEQFFRTWDEPLGDPAIVPTWQLARHTRQHVTVALSGDGGDELFAGYNAYEQVQPTPRRLLAWFLESWRRRVGIGRDWPLGCANQSEYYQLLHCPSFTRSELKLLFPDWSSMIEQATPGAVFNHWLEPTVSPVRQWQLVDLHTYLVDNNLARVDRASMAHGLEVRVPLLDHRVVEFALSLPEDVTHLNGVSKRTLRELTTRHLPPSVATKRKQGFSFPLGQIICRKRMSAEVKTGVLARSGLLSIKGFQSWCQSPASSATEFKLWLLFVLEKWAHHWLFKGK